MMERSAISPRRVAVIGTMASGKSTLAAAIAATLGAPHIELDGIRHGPNWAETPDDRIREIVATRLTGDAWVTDGNYRAVRDLIWQQVDTLVWLDYPIAVSLWRVSRRTLSRVIGHRELWNGNRETWRNTVFSRDNHWLWILRSHGKRRCEYAALVAEPAHAHLTVVRLRSPRAAARWLAALSGEIAPP